jgi:uncharacterized repeat protein (TIGR03803 family)
MTPDGALTTLAHFAGTNGCSPHGALVQASDGNLYGTTTYGGVAGHGTIFRMTPAGVLTYLGSLYGPASGGYPIGDLTEGPDGWLYGVTQYGYGTIFKVSTNGDFGTVHWFDIPDSYLPSGGLLLSSDGNFYGVTSGGGASYGGSVYRLGRNGTFGVVASFLHWVGNAEHPNGKLLEAPDGGLYGVANSPGDAGAVFRVSKTGELTTVAAFTDSSYGGEMPVGPLARGNDGNLYGACYEGGTGYGPPQPCATTFRVSPEGAVALLFSLSGYGGQYSGAYPYAGLIKGADGNLYGTTDSGGVQGGGNIFRIIMPGNECQLTCPTNISVCNDRGRCGGVVNFGPPVTTNCNGFIITTIPPSGSFFPCRNKHRHVHSGRSRIGPVD